VVAWFDDTLSGSRFAFFDRHRKHRGIEMRPLVQYAIACTAVIAILHPASIRADVRTDRLEQYLSAGIELRFRSRFTEKIR
jgi:hypothetical protein